ncbi:MAG: DNA polymerase III subunit alpha, partial [Flavisolibacter sp.]|nr:DNA polymerase III subunit alpha [Flavisolibacter sp.]
ANHRISRQGNKFGSFILEDYTGKTEIVLFGDDYVKYQAYLQQGHSVFITGAFRQRFNKAEYEFRINSVVLAENVKTGLTKQLCLQMDVRNVQKEIVDFLEKNLRQHPGKSCLKLTALEPKNNWKANLISLDNGFELNYELIEFLENKPEIEIQVATV